jgi:hypothetical protein
MRRKTLLVLALAGITLAGCATVNDKNPVRCIGTRDDGTAYVIRENGEKIEVGRSSAVFIPVK